MFPIVQDQSQYIGANVWKNGGDMRDVISIGKLVRKSDGPEHIDTGSSLKNSSIETTGVKEFFINCDHGRGITPP